MADFPIDTGIRKIGAQTSETNLLADALWFGVDPEPVTILLSNTNILATIVVDFAFSVPTIVEFTLDGGDNFIAFNNGNAVTGGQSRFIDVVTGSEINFKAKQAGNLIRCIVSSVP